MGTPARAKLNLSDDPRLQRRTQGQQASHDISVQVYLPVELPAPGITPDDVRNVVLAVLGALLLAALAYLSFPFGRKAYARWRRRRVALASGARASVVQAYAEW